MKNRKAACIALAALMILLFLAPAFAEQTERNLMMGTGGLADYDYVYIGYYNECHFKWNIIPQGIFSDEESRITLFSRDLITSSDDPKWANDFVKSLSSFMFTHPAERSAIPDLYMPHWIGIRLLYEKKQDVAGIGTTYWSTYSEIAFNWEEAYYVTTDGYSLKYDENDYHGNQEWVGHVRPYGDMDKAAVLFISKADGGKNLGSADTGFVSTDKQTDEDINTWRFTLKDAANAARMGFTVESAELNENKTEATVTYTGAQTGPNEYISAMITDANSNILYYGRIQPLDSEADASGTVTISCPSGVVLGGDRHLYVFNEQYNGGENDQTHACDYASGLWRINWDDPIAFSSVTANGSDMESTTELTLTFGKDVDNLTAGDITLTGATTDEITKVSGKTGQYILGISNITVADKSTVTVKMEKSGWGFVPSSRTVAVRRHLPFAKVTAAPTEKSGLTYSGLPQELVNAGTAVGGTMQYSLEKDGVYSPAIPTGIAPQEYTVYYKAVGDEDHRDSAVGSVFVSIGKGILTAEGSGVASGVYGQKLSELTVTGLTAKLGNTTIAGTWKLSGDEVVNAGNSETCEAAFTPSDVAEIYAPLTARVALDISKAILTDVTVPEDRTLDVYCVDAAAAISRLPETLIYAVGDVGTTELKISWQCDGYSSLSDAENTFVWKIDDDEKMTCYELADGVAQSGSIKMKNASMLRVELTGEGLNHADGRYVYGDDLVVTLQAGGKTAARMLKSTFSQPEAKQMALYKRVEGQPDEQISHPVSEENGQYVLTVRTEDKQLAIGEHTIVAKYVGDANVVGAETVYTVSIARKPLTLSDVTAQSRYYRAGDKTVDIIGAKLNGLEADADGTDDVQFAAGQKGILISDEAGMYTSVVLAAPVLTGMDTAWYTMENTEYATNVSIMAIPADGLHLHVSVNTVYTDADVQKTDLGKIPELDTVAEIDAQLRINVAQKGALMENAVLYDLILEYLDADDRLKYAEKEHFPKSGIEIILPVIKGTTPLTHAYTVVHMFAKNTDDHNAGEVEYPVPTVYQNEKGEWMLKFTVTGMSPMMVAAAPIPSADVLPQTGDHSNALLYVMMLAISVISLAEVKKHRTE